MYLFHIGSEHVELILDGGEFLLVVGAVDVEYSLFIDTDSYFFFLFCFKGSHGFAETAVLSISFFFLGRAFLLLILIEEWDIILFILFDVDERFGLSVWRFCGFYFFEVVLRFADGSVVAFVFYLAWGLGVFCFVLKEEKVLEFEDSLLKVFYLLVEF